MKKKAFTLAVIAISAAVSFAAPAAAGRGHGFDETILKWSEDRDRAHARRSHVRAKRWSRSQAARLRARRAKAAAARRAKAAAIRRAKAAAVQRAKVAALRRAKAAAARRAQLAAQRRTAVAARARAEARARAKAAASPRSTTRLDEVEAELRRLRAENRRLRDEQVDSPPPAPLEDQSINNAQSTAKSDRDGPSGTCKRFVPGADFTISVPCSEG